MDLPDESGYELCARVREPHGLPIVFPLRLHGGAEQSGDSPSAGTITSASPYSLRELELRVRSRIRAGRAAERPGSRSTAPS